MGRLTPVSRVQLIRRFKELGFKGPFSGGEHQFLLREKRPASPEALEGDYYLQDILSLNLERAVQICVDLASSHGLPRMILGNLRICVILRSSAVKRLMQPQRSA